MTINTRGGGVTHTHTPDKGQQCSLVLIQSRLVRWLVVRALLRVRVSVGWLCIRQKKSVWLSLLYIHTHTIYTYTHPHTQAETAQRTKLCVHCCLWRVFVCVCVVVVVVVVRQGSAGGVRWWGLSLWCLLFRCLWLSLRRMV